MSDSGLQGNGEADLESGLRRILADLCAVPDEDAALAFMDRKNKSMGGITPWEEWFRNGYSDRLKRAIQSLSSGGKK